MLKFIAQATKNKANFFKPQYKRELAKNKVKRDKNSAGKDDDDAGTSKLATIGPGPTKRIKQKSLAAIVAQNRARVGNTNVNNTTQMVNKNNANKREKVKGTGKLITRINETGKNEKNNLEESSKPLVAFTKTAPGLTTILAKPREDNRPKKSLSDIFSKSTSTNNTDTNILTDNKPEEAGVSVETKKYTRPSTTTLMANKPGKQQKNNTENKGDKIFKKPTGKISSLFGNNPDVPNIGQRLVKPVNEPMFSIIKFSDLDIHPYSVCNYFYLFALSF